MSQTHEETTPLQLEIASEFVAYRKQLAKQPDERSQNLLEHVDNQLAALFATNPIAYSSLKDDWTRELVAELSRSLSNSRKYEILRSYVEGETRRQSHKMRKLQ